MSVEHEARTPWLPPRWFIRLAWSVHRGVYRIGIDQHLDAYAARRPHETAVVVLAPRESASPPAAG